MLPQAYEIDQTPLKMLAQLAEQEREYQRQRQVLQLKEEQNKIDLFGGTQKQILDMSSKLPYEMQRQFMAGAMPAVKNILKSGVDLKTANELVFETLTNLQSEVGGVNQWVAKSKEVAKTLGEQGYDPTNVEAELNRHLYNIQADPQTGQQIIGPPKKVSELGNFDEYLKNHILDRKELFWDMNKGMDSVTKFAGNVKGAIDKNSITTDPTGRQRSTVEYQTELFPWTKAVEDKDPITGKPVYYTVLDSTPMTTKDGKPLLDSKGKPVEIISENAYNSFVSSEPKIKTTIEAGGTQLINEENKRRFGTVFPTEEQLNNGAIDPKDKGNQMIYSRLFLSNLPQMQRFKLQKDIKSSNVKDNPPSVNVYTGQDQQTLPVSMQDRVNQSVAGNTDFIKPGGDVTEWFSFPIFGPKDDLRSPTKVIYDKATNKFQVTLPGKKPKVIEYSPQQMTDYTITKLPDMSYTKDPRKWRSFEKSTSKPTSNIKWN